jgi:hypothetical protein
LHWVPAFFVVVEELVTVCFHDHFHAFVVSDTGQLGVCQSTELKDHHPLAVHKVQFDDTLLRLIAPRYKIV